MVHIMQNEFRSQQTAMDQEILSDEKNSFQHRFKHKITLERENYKRNVIEPLLKQFSKDTFVLVGDTGEQDPTIYAGLARDYPQVIQILIRNVTNESSEDYRKTFEGLAAERWQLFDDPSEVDWTPGK